MPQIELGSVMRAVPCCPVCGGTDREPNPAPRGHISPYTKTAADLVGLSPEELFERAPLWICRSCTSTWHDPWFTDDFSETFYSYVCGQHFYGWASLTHWLKQKPATFVATRHEVYRLLRENLPGPVSYAELNCPSAGMAFAEMDARSGAPAREEGITRLRELSHVYGKSSVFDRPSAAKSAAMAYADRETPEAFLVERTLLKEDSPYCWGRSCVHAGVSCHAYAQGFLFDRIVTLRRAEETGLHFDLVGTFVILDHAPDPVALMKRLLKLGTRVLLEMHGPGWTDLQHFYAFGPKFPSMFEDVGATYRDLTPWARAHGVPGSSNGSQFFLLSTSDDLSWVPPGPAK